MATASAFDSLLNPAALTPDQQAALDSVLEDLKLKPQAQALVDLGLEYKAKRLTLCGSEYKFDKHGKHAAQRQNISQCGYRSCRDCAKGKALQHFARFKPMEAMIDTHFTHIEFTYVFDMTLSRMYISLLKDIIASELPEGTLAKTVERDGQMVTKVLHVKPLTNEQRLHLIRGINILDGDVTMTLAIHHKRDFARALESVTAFGLPDDPQKRAEFEVIFEGYHQLQTLVPTKYVSTENALTVLVDAPDPQDPTKRVKLKVRRCRQCGEPCTHYSQRFNALSTLAELGQKVWYSYLTGLPDPDTA